MPRVSGGLRPEVGEIVQAVLGDLSLDSAAGRLKYRITKTPIADLKRGKVGYESSARALAEGFWQRFCEQFGDAITAEYGECTAATSSDWFARKCGFAPRVKRRADLTYEPETEYVTALGLRGLGELPEEDRESLLATWREQLALLRRARGLE